MPLSIVTIMIIGRIPFSDSAGNVDNARMDNGWWTIDNGGNGQCQEWKMNTE